MGKNVFHKTRIAGWEERLCDTFPTLDAGTVFQSACTILSCELSAVNDRGNRMIGMHIRRNILPGYACYRALLNAGIDSQSAVAFVEAELCRSVQPMSRLCHRLSDKRWVYPLVTVALRFALRRAYPKEGWTIQNQNLSNQSAYFEMTTCLYCEELKKRGALELCPAFCQTDHASYDSLVPGVVFTRNTTLAEGGEVCDFCFMPNRPQDGG